jgi:hypothetical protein
LATHTLYLRPATGLTPGATTNDSHTPTQRGSGAWAGHQPVLRWSLPPYQFIPAEGLVISVAAFHGDEDGIDYVEFQANGGTKAQVSAGAFNAATNCVDYFLTLNPADDDGLVTVQAVVYPTNGTTRAIEADFFSNENGDYPVVVRYVSPDGDDEDDGLTDSTPKLDPQLAMRDIGTTLPSSDCRVYLMAGTHRFKQPAFPGNTTTQDADAPWCTYQAAPGLDYDDVTVETDLAEDGQPFLMSLLRVRWYNVKFVGNPMPYTTTGEVWYDTCKIDGVSAFAQQTAFAFGESTGGRYITDSIVTNTVEGGTGFQLMRGCTINNTLAGGPWVSECVIDTTVEDVSPTLSGITLVVDGTTNTDVAPTGVTVAAQQVGYTVTITNGGGWTGGDYLISSIQAGKWRLNSSPAATSTSGGMAVLDSGAHPDVWRSTDDMDNVLLYGLTTPDMAAQPNSAGVVLFGAHVYSDIAFVDCDVSAGSGVGANFAMGGELRNIYIKDCNWRGAAGPDVDYDEDETVVFENTNFYEYNSSTPADPQPDWGDATIR